MFLSDIRIKESKSNNEKMLQHGIEQPEEQLTFEEMLELEIKKVVSSIDVKQYTGMTYSEQDSFDNKIKDVWLYMSIFKSNNGIDQYMSADTKQFFLEKKIAKKIGITDIESNINLIMEYAYQKMVEEVYVIHATNSKRANGMLNP